MSSPIKEALKHLLIVFAYSGMSAVIPLMIAWMQNDSRWAVLIPIINSVWYAVTRYLKEKKLIREQQESDIIS